jgi:hypothetical protein
MGRKNKRKASLLPIGVIWDRDNPNAKPRDYREHLAALKNDPEYRARLDAKYSEQGTRGE